MTKVGFLLERLKEPGSVRSLVLLLFLVKGRTVDEAQVGLIVDSLLSILALLSFLMPSPSAPALKPEDLAATVQSAVSQALTTLRPQS